MTEAERGYRTTFRNVTGSRLERQDHRKSVPISGRVLRNERGPSQVGLIGVSSMGVPVNDWLAGMNIEN